MKMTTKKISIELPSQDKIAAGLTPREMHRPIAHAEQAVADAQSKLEKAQRDLADREHLIAEMPAKVYAGQLSAEALTEATRRRDISALLIPPAEEALKRARERLVVEEANAKRVVHREFAERVEVLERAFAQVGPVIAEIRELADVLIYSRGQGGSIVAVDWPESAALTERLSKFFQ